MKVVIQLIAVFLSFQLILKFEARGELDGPHGGWRGRGFQRHLGAWAAGLSVPVRGSHRALGFMPSESQARPALPSARNPPRRTEQVSSCPEALGRPWRRSLGGPGGRGLQKAWTGSAVGCYWGPDEHVPNTRAGASSSSKASRVWELSSWRTDRELLPSAGSGGAARACAPEGSGERRWGTRQHHGAPGPRVTC